MEGINPVLIIGTGPEGRIALEIFNDNGIMVYAFLTDKKSEAGITINDMSVFGTPDHPDVKKIFKESSVDFFIAAGEPSKRHEMHKAVHALTGKPAINAFHRMSAVSQHAVLGFGNLFSAFSAVHPNSDIGDYNIFHTGVSIEPDVKIGSYNTFNSGVRIGSNVIVGDEVFVGTGAIIYPGVKIGNKAVIGAGSVVLKSVDAGKTVFGNPAKES